MLLVVTVMLGALPAQAGRFQRPGAVTHRDPACAGGHVAPTIAPLGDYGDAPDDTSTGYTTGALIGAFPTRFNSTNAPRPGTTGAFTLRTDQEWLGRSVSREHGASDPRDPDGVPNLGGSRLDGCDAYDDGNPLLGASSPPRLFVSVSAAQSAARTPRYLNVVADLNRDGRWNGPGEWTVRNCAVTVAPGTRAIRVSCPWLRLKDIHTVATRGALGQRGATRPLPPVWVRVLLTRYPLGHDLYGRNGWDGAGPAQGFPVGEVEDYFAPAAKPASTFLAATRTPARAATPARTATPPPPSATLRSTNTPTTTYTPAATATLPPTFAPSVTPTVQPLSGVAATNQYDPTTGQLQFHVRLAQIVLDSRIFSIGLFGPPWGAAQPAAVPRGWSWVGSGDGWRAVTQGAPLFFDEIVTFGLVLPPGTVVPDTVFLQAYDRTGLPLGAFPAVNPNPATSTPTPLPADTNTPVPSATPPPLAGVHSVYHFTPGTGNLVIDIDVTSAQANNLVYDLELLGSPWNQAVPGTISPGWQWAYLSGGLRAVSGGSPLSTLGGVSLQMTLPPPYQPPAPLILLASGAFGETLGTIASQPQ